VAGGSATATYLDATPGIMDPELTIEVVRDRIDEILDRSALRAITDPRNPAGEPNELLSLMVRQPYAGA
jgi:hypothetical protein